jgi:hypothetical protein
MAKVKVKRVVFDICVASVALGSTLAEMQENFKSTDLPSGTGLLKDELLQPLQLRASLPRKESFPPCFSLLVESRKVPGHPVKGLNSGYFSEHCSIDEGFML